MSASIWIVGLVASLAPWLAHAQDGTFSAPQRVDGLAVSVDFEPAGMAPNWADSHRSSGVDRAAPSVRPDLDRHLVIAIVDETSRDRVSDAVVEVTLTPTVPPGSPFHGKLELMAKGGRPSYGTMVTIDPLAEYALEVVIRRPGQAQPSQVRFGPARVPQSGSHGGLRVQHADGT